MRALELAEQLDDRRALDRMLGAVAGEPLERPAQAYDWHAEILKIAGMMPGFSRTPVAVLRLASRDRSRAHARLDRRGDPWEYIAVLYDRLAADIGARHGGHLVQNAADAVVEALDTARAVLTLWSLAVCCQSVTGRR